LHELSDAERTSTGNANGFIFSLWNELQRFGKKSGPPPHLKNFEARVLICAFRNFLTIKSS
jgi:hypothetical protein